jgi:hypothetical protein
MITTVKKTSSAAALEETKAETGRVCVPVEIFVMSATQPK